MAVKRNGKAVKVLEEDPLLLQFKEKAASKKPQ
ncbi:hypothetical protein COLO4_03982 [Corchorus olitorius]|uniref:Uncharacterized protein n=1 Tax=Corchorus olitorius TaxID=93759 RepID=A0A1R3KVP5_9ROSI|nr:hypothetical protein COLO4_03982 [Corchorus olitorius]